MKVLILGSTGFLGKNIYSCFQDNYSYFDFYYSSRNIDETKNLLYFDILNKESWSNITKLNPDIIINCIAYGVIKLETDIDKMFNINYIIMSDFYNYILSKNSNLYWIQIGTAFEYDLTQIAINEKSTCNPKTHYGISKLMMSNFLLNKSNNFIILRPFGMFGKFEDTSKFFPALIKAQKFKQSINLSDGLQCRDYIFVEDFIAFIKTLITKINSPDLPKVINIGSNQSKSLREYSNYLIPYIPFFDNKFWNWGQISFRENESFNFYSNSKISYNYGFINSPLSTSFKKIVNYYYDNF